MKKNIIDFNNKKKVIKIETEENIKETQLILKITFDDKETLIIDLDLLEEINEKVGDELQVLSKKATEKLVEKLGILADLLFTHGKKDYEKILNSIKR